MSIFRSRTYFVHLSRPILLFGVLALLGCSHTARIDLAERRSAGLLADQALLGEREQMTFEAPLSLDDAVAVGLVNNLDLRVARFMEEIADRDAMSEKLKMLPRLDLNGVYSERSDYIQREYVDPDTGEVSLSNTISQDKTTRTLDLSLSWNILDFGLSYLRSRQAAYAVEIRRMERIRQAQNLAADIATAFWRSVLAEEDLKLVGRIEDRLREFKGDADDLVAQRRLDPIVAKEMERQLLNLTISAADLQAEVAGARIELARLMGLTPGTRFELAIPEGLLEERLERLPEPSDIDPRELEEMALRRRPELFSADLREDVQEDEVRAAMIQMFPGLEFNASYRYDGDEFLANSDWFNFGGRFTASLLALPARHAAWNARKIEAEMARVQRALLSAGIVAQVHVSLQNFYIREKQYQLKEQAYRVSGDLSDMSLERNRAGMMGFSDAVVAQRLMENFLSRLERDRTIVAMMGAYHTLMVAAGFDYDQWNRPLAEMEKTRIPVPGEPETMEDSRMEDRSSQWRFPGTIGNGRSEPAT